MFIEIKTEKLELASSKTLSKKLVLQNLKKARTLTVSKESLVILRRSIFRILRNEDE
jgi:hypothetical protein